jgi:hypothetical protein
MFIFIVNIYKFLYCINFSWELYDEKLFIYEFFYPYSTRSKILSNVQHIDLF